MLSARRQARFIAAVGGLLVIVAMRLSAVSFSPASAASAPSQPGAQLSAALGDSHRDSRQMQILDAHGRIPPGALAKAIAQRQDAAVAQVRQAFAARPAA